MMTGVTNVKVMATITIMMTSMMIGSAIAMTALIADMTQRMIK